MTQESGIEARAREAAGEVEIEAPPERVWRALTEAAELERWFPLEARVEPGEGGTIHMSWGDELSGEERILRWDPPRHLRTAWEAPGLEGGTLVTDYRLEGRGGRTFLRVVTSGFPPDASWDEWLEGTRRGWRYELRSLKHYLERHDGQDRRVVLVRRRVPLSTHEAWERLFGPAGLGERPLGGRPIQEEPGTQYAAVVREPADALLRVSLEPTLPGTPGRAVMLFLAAWGEQGTRLPELEREWSELLERLYPEGESV